MKNSNDYLEKFKSKIISVVMWVEIILAIIIIISVILGSKDLIDFIIQIFSLSAVSSYDMFQKFLSHILLLVIGLEMALMLVKHTPNSIMEVMLYAVARKLLVYGTSALEILLGVLSLVCIFFIKKYLVSSKNDSSIKNENISN